MNPIFAILFLFAIAWTAPEIQGQSRRVYPSPSDRPKSLEQPVSTPTPLPAEDEDGGDVISVDTKLVTVPVRILDRKNRFIGGLEKQNFSIFDDGIQQEVAYFTNESQPF